LIIDVPERSRVVDAARRAAIRPVHAAIDGRTMISADMEAFAALGRSDAGPPTSPNAARLTGPNANPNRLQCHDERVAIHHRGIAHTTTFIQVKYHS
jgi:hypothetical protein